MLNHMNHTWVFLLCIVWTPYTQDILYPCGAVKYTFAADEECRFLLQHIFLLYYRTHRDHFRGGVEWLCYQRQHTFTYKKKVNQADFCRTQIKQARGFLMDIWDVSLTERGGQRGDSKTHPPLASGFTECVGHESQNQTWLTFPQQTLKEPTFQRVLKGKKDFFPLKQTFQ